MAPKKITKPIKPRIGGILTSIKDTFEVYAGGSNTLGNRMAPYLYHGQRHPTHFDSFQTLESNLDKGI